jgi:hypothetical protein
MRGRGGLVLLAALLLSGCGLETVETLASPPVDFSTQTDFTRLSLTHSASLYDQSVFQGYYIYYKVYTTQAIDLSGIQSDRDTLATSPTVDKLASMGYYRISVSGTSVSGTPTSDSPIDLEPFFPRSLSDGDVITLDFFEFVSAGATKFLTRPQAKLNSSDWSGKSYLYRNQGLSAGHVSFWNLPTTVATTDPDVAAWSTSDSRTSGQEIDVFIAAYGMTGTLQAVYSKPVPWGVIRIPSR